jgi:hypothetical protein
MKLNEILGEVFALAEAEDFLGPNDRLTKQWIKSIKEIDKSVSTGYSLVGEFISESEELEPGLYLIYQQLNRSWIVEESFVKWYRDSSLKRKILKDEDGNIVSEKQELEKSKIIRRGILFDFSDQISLIYCRFLPEKWAKHLWKPIEAWIEQQPHIEAKIKFWETEVALRTDALRQSQQRLDALRRHITADSGAELDPKTAEWLKTAAVLGNKKAIVDRLEGV